MTLLHTLSYAVRGGRVPNTIGTLGIKLGIRPIMTINEKGEGAAFSFGFSQKGISKKIKKQVRARKNHIQAYSIVHADNPKLANEYKEMLTALLHKEPAYVTEISSVVAMHAGLGSVAVSFVEEEGV